MSIVTEVLAKAVDAGSMFWLSLAGPEKWVALYLVYVLLLLLFKAARAGKRQRMLLVTPIAISDQEAQPVA